MSTETNSHKPAGAEQTVKGGTGDMFDAIASRYDMLNRIMSMGQDQYWRTRAVKSLGLSSGDTVLDVATGTGDLAIMIAQKNPGVRVEGIDPSRNMVTIGNGKVAQKSLERRVELKIGDGQALPFEDNSFDGAVVAFGIRNFPDRLEGLKEMTRVTRPGRKVVVLELSEPRGKVLGTAARAYIHHIVPRIGSALSGKKEYRYLQESIEAFPAPDDFVALMREAGLSSARAYSLSFGAVTLFVGTV